MIMVSLRCTLVYKPRGMAKMEGITTPSRFGMARGGKLAVTEVALMVTVREPGCDFPQEVSPMGSQHSAQTDCGRGVLPLTKRNFMPRPSTYESEPLAMPVDRSTYR
jgi:hypothetical protein